VAKAIKSPTEPNTSKAGARARQDGSQGNHKLQGQVPGQYRRNEKVQQTPTANTNMATNYKHEDKCKSTTNGPS